MTTLQQERADFLPEEGASFTAGTSDNRIDKIRALWPYLLIIAVAAILAYSNVSNAPAFQNDEGVYTYQARSIWGGSLAPYSYWYDHPPLGWLQLATFGWIPKLFGLGDSAVGSMRYVVASYLVLNSVLLYALARRTGLPQVFALVASSLFVLSPLSLVLGRQVLLDNLATPWILGAFLLVLSRRHNLAAHIGAGACFAIAVLSKETMAIYGPVLLYLLWRNSHRHTRSFSLLGFLTVGALFLSAYPLMALLKGELLPRQGRSTLWDALVFQFVQRRGSGYLWQHGSARSDLISSWVYFDSYLIIGGVAAALLLVFNARTRWITFAVALFLLPLVASQGYLPSMYIVAGLPFLALAVASFAHQIWRLSTAHSHRLRRPVKVLTAVVMATALYSVTMPSWQLHNTATLSQKQNNDWVQTVSWMKKNVSRQAVIVVPPSMWQDLRDAGWPNQWAVIATEKVDLDPVEFARRHPGGWRELNYVVVNEQVGADLGYLGLTQLNRAVQAGVPVASFGGTHILRIVP